MHSPNILFERIYLLIENTSGEFLWSVWDTEENITIQRTYNKTRYDQKHWKIAHFRLKWFYNQAHTSTHTPHRYNEMNANSYSCYFNTYILSGTCASNGVCRLLFPLPLYLTVELLFCDFYFIFIKKRKRNVLYVFVLIFVARWLIFHLFYFLCSWKMLDDHASDTFSYIK